jgi:hypothetical protein
MQFTTAGLEFLAGITAGQGTAFNNSNAYIGVGDSDTAFDPEQTDLQGTNKVRMPMEPGYPIVTDNAITFKAVFAPSYANFTWKEWGIFNAASGGVMLARVVELCGTKLESPSQTWVLEGTLEYINEEA